MGRLSSLRFAFAQHGSQCPALPLPCSSPPNVAAAIAAAPPPFLAVIADPLQNIIELCLAVAMLPIAFTLPRRTQLRLCHGDAARCFSFARPGCADHCHSCALQFFAIPLQILSPLCPRKAMRRSTLPLPNIAQSRHAIPLRNQSELSSSSAKHHQAVQSNSLRGSMLSIANAIRCSA